MQAKQFNVKQKSWRKEKRTRIDKTKPSDAGQQNADKMAYCFGCLTYCVKINL